MRSVFNVISGNALLRAVIYIALGVLILFFPQTITNIIVYVLAAGVAVLGVANIINFIRGRDTEEPMSFDLVSGILFLVLAALMVIFTRQLVSVLPVFLGVLLIINAASDLAQTISYGRKAGKQNVFLIALDVLIILGGIVVILNPFASAILLIRIYGAIIIVNGVGGLIAFFTYRKIDRETKE